MTLSTITLADLDRLYRGFQAITFEEFCGVLLKINGSCESYSRSKWPAFRENPMRYNVSLCSETQGEALLALAIKKAEEK